ncbi:hypothetical protein K501DRAFT_266509 [Backusella circina FSU 941]|nr:hypothetical protein K501DRAFT_266509 [Backusella circina FSU 941]
MLLASILSLSSIVATATAVVWDATILSPTNETVLTAGQTLTVTWETEVAGYQIPDDVRGMLVLGYLTNNPVNEHLHWTLAERFKLNSGSIDVTLPDDLESMDNYILALLGDSGDVSEKFTIKAKGGDN